VSSLGPLGRRWQGRQAGGARDSAREHGQAPPAQHPAVQRRQVGAEPGSAGRERRPARGARPLTVLVSASGAPGTAALLRALRGNGERHVRLVGTDMSERAIGRHLCDAFHLVPPGGDPGFADAILDVCAREGVDAVIPQSSFDLLGLAEAKDRFGGTAVLVSSPDATRRSNDKAATYAFLDAIGVKGPAWRRVQGSHELAAAARDLGYPDADVCFKPLFSSGSRGFRVLSASADRREQLLGNRPGVAGAMQIEEVVELFPEGGGPDLLVMELATGKERTVDGIASSGRILLGHPKTREAIRAGLAMYFETLDDPQLMEIASRIVAELRLDHFFNIQLVGDHVIEINPRISTVVYQEDLNLPYLGVKHALGEISEEELTALRARVRRTRRALRFFDQIEWDA
jgi:carbamoyl-phosphate synthase large subunit